jgi:hypothetical protein
MRVRVSSVSQDGEHCRVTLSSSYGELVAEWRGSTPALGGEYDAELETNEYRRWGSQELDVAQSDWVGIEREEDRNLVQAYLESAQSDGYTVVRLGRTKADPVLVMEADGEPPPPGTLVYVRIGDLSAWDQRL